MIECRLMRPLPLPLLPSSSRFSLFFLLLGFERHSSTPVANPNLRWSGTRIKHPITTQQTKRREGVSCVSASWRPLSPLLASVLHFIWWVDHFDLEHGWQWRERKETMGRAFRIGRGSVEPPDRSLSLSRDARNLGFGTIQLFLSNNRPLSVQVENKRADSLSLSKKNTHAPPSLQHLLVSFSSSRPHEYTPLTCVISSEYNPLLRYHHVWGIAQWVWRCARSLTSGFF
jgi:hypothetical protein